MDNEVINTYLAQALGLDPTGKIGPRSYRAIRDKVHELARPFHFWGSMEYALFAVIRNRLGRRVTELREADVPQVWAVLAEIEPRVNQVHDVIVTFECRAIKKVFGPAGMEAFEQDANKSLAKLDAMDVPDMPEPSYGGNVVRFPGAA